MRACWHVGLQLKVSRVRVMDKVTVSAFYFLLHLQPAESRIPAA